MGLGKEGFPDPDTRWAHTPEHIRPAIMPGARVPSGRRPRALDTCYARCYAAVRQKRSSLAKRRPFPPRAHPAGLDFYSPLIWPISPDPLGPGIPCYIYYSLIARVLSRDKGEVASSPLPLSPAQPCRIAPRRAPQRGKTVPLPSDFFKKAIEVINVPSLRRLLSTQSHQGEV